MTQSLEVALDAAASINGFLDVAGSRAAYKNRFVEAARSRAVSKNRCSTVKFEFCKWPQVEK
jgi:hypothetical protein